MESFFDVDEDKTLQKSGMSTKLFFEHESERLTLQPFHIMYNVFVAEEIEQLLLPAKYSLVFFLSEFLVLKWPLGAGDCKEEAQWHCDVFR